MLLRSMPDRALRIFTAFLALAVVWTWPLVRHLSSRIPHDRGDPILNTWLLWWNAHAIPFTERWWNPPIFFPMPGALALSEHLAGIGLIGTPIQLLHGNALAAYNVALILSFAMSGFFSFLLVRHLVAPRAPSVREVAALCGALAYGFGPYRAGQLAHLQVLTSQWMPLALLAMHRYVEGGRPLWLLVFAAAWLPAGAVEWLLSAVLPCSHRSVARVVCRLERGPCARDRPCRRLGGRIGGRSKTGSDLDFLVFWQHDLVFVIRVPRWSAENEKIEI